MPTLLVIDDETSIQHAFRRAFRDQHLTIQTASSAAEGVAAIVRDRPDVIVLDVHLPDATGLTTFQQIRAVDARLPVILITGHGTTDLAIEAMKAGAFDYLLKPLELVEIRSVVDRAIRSSQLMSVPASLPDDQSPPIEGDRLVGRCPAMQEVYKAIGRVATQDVIVLIRGESGTGKELVARAIYQHSARGHKPFLAVNCAAIPETLLESELFGHEKGAFTGADRKRIGRFEQANGGTLFLDEVGEMTPLTQSKVLRVLQERQFERVGGDETIRTDARVIAATNADLEAMIEDGRFRKDLYFRFNVFSIWLPPLRERGDDLQLLIDHYVRRFGKELGKPVHEIAPETLAALKAYRWPGNVRELQSVLKQAILQMPGPVLLVECLPNLFANRHASTSNSTDASSFDWASFVDERIAAGSESIYAEAIERTEREVLTRVLRHTGGNQVQASRLLGITRGSLRTKIRTLGITISREVWSEDDQDDS